MALPRGALLTACLAAAGLLPAAELPQVYLTKSATYYVGIQYPGSGNQLYGGGNVEEAGEVTEDGTRYFTYKDMPGPCTYYARVPPKLTPKKDPAGGGGFLGDLADGLAGGITAIITSKVPVVKIVCGGTSMSICDWIGTQAQKPPGYAGPECVQTGGGAPGRTFTIRGTTKVIVLAKAGSVGGPDDLQPMQASSSFDKDGDGALDADFFQANRKKFRIIEVAKVYEDDKTHFVFPGGVDPERLQWWPYRGKLVVFVTRFTECEQRADLFRIQEGFRGEGEPGGEARWKAAMAECRQEILTSAAPENAFGKPILAFDPAGLTAEQRAQVEANMQSLFGWIKSTVRIDPRPDLIGDQPTLLGQEFGGRAR